MNVLSLFDGLSGCRIALERVGITPDKYYASEIDKYAITVAQANYPDTVQLGSVTDWQLWDIDWASIDLVTGGFPCATWSVAGKQMGDKDERGMLFWTMLDVMKTVMQANPSAKFLIENVKMKKEFEQYITHHTEQVLGHVHKTLINSALVSAQNRNRYYWTNFAVNQPEDRGIVLADILEIKASSEYSSIPHPDFKGGSQLNPYYKSQANTIHDPGKKSPTLCAGTHGYALGHIPVHAGAIRGRYIVDGKRQDHKMLTAGLTEQRLEVRQDEKTNSLTTVQKDNVVVEDLQELTYRKLTPLECERLQTLPDNFTAHVSNTQRYKMIGNGWTIDVIAHIFRDMLIDSIQPLQQDIVIPKGTLIPPPLLQQIFQIIKEQAA
jgi:DNA-cytosine methyltransferase